MDLRSSLSFATVRPRYSVSRTAVEPSNRFVSSATEASLFAMATPCEFNAHRGSDARPRALEALRVGAKEKSSGAVARSSARTFGKSSSHLRGHLLSQDFGRSTRCEHRAARQPAVFGSDKRNGCRVRGQIGAEPVPGRELPDVI